MKIIRAHFTFAVLDLTDHFREKRIDRRVDAFFFRDTGEITVENVDLCFLTAKQRLKGGRLYGSVFACEALKAGKSCLVIDRRGSRDLQGGRRPVL